MAGSETPSERPLPVKRHGLLLTVLVVVACAALLARHADGRSAIPLWLSVLLQAPALIVWLRELFGREEGGTRSSGRATDRWLTVCVLVAGVGLSIVGGRLGILFTVTTVFIAGTCLVDALASLTLRVEAQVLEPRRLLRTLVGPWFLLIVAAAVLLSLPLATHSAVPDYRHNLWDHVLNNVFAAVSTACLVGTTIYAFGEEYSFFGQAVLVATTQLAGMGLAAVGLAIIQPFLGRILPLRRVLTTALALQVAAILVMASAWRSGDVSDCGGRLWWGLVHAGSALWNSGLTLRADGLARYLGNQAVFATVTTLSVIGSVGLPVILALLPRRRDRAGPDGPVGPTRSPGPWRSLPQWEIGAALVLLLAGAWLLFFCETPWRPGVVWRLPDSWAPARPVDSGSAHVSLRDAMPYSQRWTLSVFLSATLRSAGLQSTLVSRGALSWPSYGLLLIWMFIGGGAGGVGGGIRTTAIVLIVRCLVGRRAWRSVPGGETARRRLLTAVLAFVPLWLVVNAASVGLLAVVSEGTGYEVVLESVAACNSVALSTGLSLHLTWAGRAGMILTLIAGRLVPVAYWLAVSRKFTQGFIATNETRSSNS